MHVICNSRFTKFLQDLALNIRKSDLCKFSGFLLRFLRCKLLHFLYFYSVLQQYNDLNGKFLVFILQKFV